MLVFYLPPWHFRYLQPKDQFDSLRDEKGLRKDEAEAKSAACTRLDRGDVLLDAVIVRLIKTRSTYLPEAV
jgi:hypothetical protein